ncbi:MAG: PSD1 and planctomycete cytochrome C domain-containing protein [Gemmataceae bacterium]|nr:PSD1 and planctomycete cytochrome C domain-containing protein [Gemmataceae bacterium]
MTVKTRAALAVCVALLAPAGLRAQDKVSAEAVDFFEKRVRPVLAEHCYTCHGLKKQQAGLRLDSGAALRKGSDGGPVLVPGDPDRSLLVQAVRHQGDLKMPPKGKLPEQAVADLAAWVKVGAPWPETGTIAQVQVADAWKKHWAFQPVKNPPLPRVKNLPAGAAPVDAFILAALEAKGLALAPPADRRTLIRRASFDLIGLPPTPEEVEAFEKDSSPDAFAKVVDRLLASPHYGERWGRHWLDVARYADTKGYVFQEERRYAYAYTYRDYVVRSFNEDKPYDQFIVEQLAADRLLPLTLPSPPAGGEGRVRGGDPRTLAAMGFLTVGRRFLNNVHDIIDDRIDTMTRGLMGLTVACARCHDHKYDPIPTADYYSLYGVFASSVEPRDLPLIGKPERTPAYLAFEKELQAREKKLADVLEEAQSKAGARWRAQAADYLLAVRNAQRKAGEDHYEAINPGDLSQMMVKRWEMFLGEVRKRHHPVLSPWLAFADLPQKEFAVRAPALAKKIAANADPARPINRLVAQAFAGKPPMSLREVTQRYASVFAEVDKLWQKAQPAKALPNREQEMVRQVLYGPASPLSVPADELRRFIDRATRDRLTSLRKQVDQLRANSPAAPPRAMVLLDRSSAVTPRVLLRGNPNSPGPVVPRQFLSVVAGPKREPFKQGSGRLEMARAIASKDNPLTARVLVNRVWQYHFGQGLVRTPGDFGLRSDPPTHPELLDWLAWRFMEEGWSVKKLHRTIMLSRVYQQSSRDDPAGQKADPDNRLLWRMNRQRLDFEALRDSLLMVAANLDRTAGGAAVDLLKEPFTGRRTIYGFIDRQNLPGMFRTFDFASPDTATPQRYSTTVPQQALFLLNSPFVLEQARGVVRSLDLAGSEGDGVRIQSLYRRIYSRAATGDEVDLGQRFVAAARAEDGAAGGQEMGVWERYAQVLLLANEFAFVD